MAGPELKHLGSFYLLALKVWEAVTYSYLFVKDRSHVLKPYLEGAEKYVESTLGPYGPVAQQKSSDFIVFVDRKVDVVINSLDSLVPEQIKNVLSAAQNTPAVAKELLGDINVRGVGPAAADYINKYQPIAEEHLYGLWKWANDVPGFPTAVVLASPMILHVACLYNASLSTLKTRSFPLAAKMPELPIEEIGKFLKAEHTVVSPEAESEVEAESE
eukprot:TRINITY_DN13386_c0_g1_i1.p1 TRINITY_DN13386_c0_g1~~TRINITY_DN13386_c0_g1_i1.p1  ORF type:complete len:216 (-),score=50.89 TRINITY_DN13386_c0_g1_i1:542-1189(-)